MGTIRVGTIALRLDYGELSTGFQKSADMSRQFFQQEISLAQRLASEHAKAAEASKHYRGALAHNNFADQDKYLGQYNRANENVAKLELKHAEMVSARKQALVQRDNQVRQQLEDQYYAATHTHEEVALRDLQRRYAFLRQMYSQNPAMMAQLGQTYAAQAAAIGAGAEAEGDGGGRVGLFGHLSRRDMRHLGRGIGSGVGMSGVGGEAGMVAGMAMTPGLLPVAAVVGLGLTVNAFMQAARDEQKALVEGQNAYNKELRESARWWENIAARSNTSLGRAAEGRAAELRDKASGIYDQMAGEDADRSWWSKGVGKSAAFLEKEYWQGKRAREADQEAQQMEWLAEDQREQQQRREKEDIQRRANESGTGLIVNSQDRQRMEASQKSDKEQEALDRKHQDERQALEAKDNAARHGDDYTDEQEAEYKARKKEMQERHRQEDDAQQKIAENRDQILEHNIALQKAADEDRTADMVGVAGLRGYDRQKTSLALRSQSEINEALRTGKTNEEIQNISARAGAENKDLDANRDEDMRRDQVAKQMQLAEATRDFATADRLAREEEQHRLEVAGATGQQLQTLLGLWDKNRQAAADAPLLKEITDTNRELEVMQGHLSKEDALKQKLREANPRASQEYIDEAAAKQRELQLREQFKNPLQEYRKFRDEVAEAESKGIITHEQAQIELRNKMHGLLGPSGEGKLEDSAAQWGNIQQALNQDDVPKMTLEEMKGLRDEAVALRREGIRLRG